MTERHEANVSIPAFGTFVGWYGGSLGQVDDITGLNVNVIQAILTVGFF